MVMLLSRRRSGMLSSSDALPGMAAQNGGRNSPPIYGLRDRTARLRLEGALCGFLCLALVGLLWSTVTITLGQDVILSGFRSLQSRDRVHYETAPDDVIFKRSSKFEHSLQELDTDQPAKDTWFEDIKYLSGKIGPAAVIRPSPATAVDPRTNVSLIGAVLDKGVVNPYSRVSRIVVNAAVQTKQQSQQGWECLLCRTGPLQPDGRWGPDFTWTGVAPQLKAGLINPGRRLTQNGFGDQKTSGDQGLKRNDRFRWQDEPELDEEDEEEPPKVTADPSGGTARRTEDRGGGESESEPDSVLHCWRGREVEVHVDWGDIVGEPSLAMQWHCLMAEGDDGFDIQWAAVLRPSDKDGVERVLFPEGKDLRRFTAVDQSQGRVAGRENQGGPQKRRLLSDSALVSNHNTAPSGSALELGEHFRGGGVNAGRRLLQADGTGVTRWARKQQLEGEGAVANITVCAGPLYGDQHLMLAEWVAFNLLMGAHKVRVYYLAGQVAPNVLPVLEYYAKTGRLEYYEWHKPEVDAFYNGQNVFYHDCYYR